MEENHSFDDLLGKFCAEVAAGQIDRPGFNDPCHGATQATLSDGSTFTLSREPDFGLGIDHSPAAQQVAMHGGQMDGWDRMHSCTPTSDSPYACLTQLDPLNGTCGKNGHQNCTPNLDAYAEQYAISDNTFEFRATPSWAGHMVLGSASIEQFVGLNPKQRPGDPGGVPGWGCNAGKSSQWYVTGHSGPTKLIPSCIPDQNGSLGPAWDGYTGTTADYVPTIFDRLDQAGVPWKIYALPNARGDSVAGWAICPTFWECQGSSQSTHVTANTQFTSDAAGTLPSVSIVVPGAANSMHQPAAMSKGDNWVGRLVRSVMTGPNWSSTAIFINFDDCGCFYDDVNPFQYSRDWGPRVPMIIVSPYAKRGYTDSTPATSVSMLAFIEHTFGLRPLNPCALEDAWDPQCTDDARDYDRGRTYDFSNVFDFSGVQSARAPVVHTRIPDRERAWLRAHPHAGNAVT